MAAREEAAGDSKQGNSHRARVRGAPATKALLPRFGRNAKGAVKIPRAMICPVWLADHPDEDRPHLIAADAPVAHEEPGDAGDDDGNDPDRGIDPDLLAQQREMEEEEAAAAGGQE